MKKFLLFLMLIAGFTVAAHMPFVAVDTKAKGLIPATFAPLQFMVWDKVQLYDSKSHTFISLSWLFLAQESAVISFSPANGLKKNFFLQSGLLNGGQENYFISAGLFNFTDKNYGIQMGVTNYSQDHFGFQFGAFNLAGMFQTGIFNLEGAVQIGLINKKGKFQIGLLNYNPDALIPLMPLINFSMPTKKAPEKLEVTTCTSDAGDESSTVQIMVEER